MKFTEVYIPDQQTLEDWRVQWSKSCDKNEDIGL